MSATKNDLSYNEVKLDYEALLTTARIAIGCLSENIRNNLGRITQSIVDKNTTCIHLSSNWLEDDAHRLAITCETLATLFGGLTRENIIIVNKPEVVKKGEKNDNTNIG